MSRVLLLVAVLVAPAVAQEAAVLGGWALPEGAVVRSVSAVTMEGAVEGTVPINSQESEVTRTTMARVEGGRLTRAVQRIESATSKVFVDGSRIPSDADPLLGRDVAVVRDGGGWRREPLGWRPSPEAEAELADPVSLDDAEYPARPVAVGETVEVGDAALRAVYPGAVAGPHRLTVRLDSLGTFEGGPAAFLTQEVGVTVDVGEGGTMRMDMTARIVRRLDWMLDVQTEWEGPISFDYPEVSVDGTMRYLGTQTVTLPD